MNEFFCMEPDLHKAQLSLIEVRKIITNNREWNKCIFSYGPLLTVTDRALLLITSLQKPSQKYFKSHAIIVFG